MTLPSWFTRYRPHQQSAIDEIAAGFDSGFKVMILDAPTGAGKTLIAESVRNRLGIEQGVYCCNTKTLQNQFSRDYSEYARVIKGRSNYPTELFPEHFDATKWVDSISCGDCTGSSVCPEDSCQYCSDVCPYVQARTSAAFSEVAILNMAYYLSINNVSKLFKQRDFIVIDECDTLESVLMSHIEVNISPSLQKRMRLSKPDKKTVVESWIEWVAYAIQHIGKYSKTLTAKTKLDRRHKKVVGRLLENLKNIVGDEENWVYTNYDTDYITFKPIRVDSFAQKLIWNTGKKFLLMSATVISPDQLAADLGLEGSEFGYVQINQAYPAKNRPVYQVPVASVTRANKEEAYGKLAASSNLILQRHDKDRIIFHTVSYELSRFLYDELKNNKTHEVFSYNSSYTREQAIEDYCSTKNSILIGSSLERGLDLPHDLCRVQVICKVPYPYLGDKQVSARLHSIGGQQWFNVLTVREIVQMTGRGVRSEDDHAQTYILDSQFSHNIYRRNKGLFPKWWRDGLQWNPAIAAELGWN